MPVKPRAQTKIPGIAVTLSAILPGLGQFYNRDPWKAAIFLVVGLALGWASSQVLPPVDAILAGRPTEGLGKLLILLFLLLICYIWSLRDAYHSAKRKFMEASELL